MQILWVDHVKAVAAALEAFDKFRIALDNLPGDPQIGSDVKVDFYLYGEPIGWSLVSEDGTSYWKIEEDGDE